MVLWLLSVAVLAQDAPAWSPFAKLQDARTNACAVRLSDPGKVLISGGIGTASTALTSAEILTGDGVPQFVAPLNSARSGHTCTLLNDGRVLVTGGAFRGSNAEIYDPAADFWLPIASAGPSRAGSTATLLQDGRVLIAGGYTEDGGLLPYVEIFDPNSNRFTASKGQLNNPRRDHASASLPDGRVVIIGGTGLDGAALRSSEFFDPVTSVIWTGPDLITARRGHTANSLEDGRILVAGGDTNTAETLDILGLRWTTLAARLSVARTRHAALAIPGNGDLFITGGTTDSLPAELFQPASNSFKTLSGAVLDGVTGAALTVGDDGSILALGGTSASTPQDTCQRILFPALTFSAAVIHPRELARVSGRNLPPNTNVTFNLDLVRGSASNSTVSATPQLRILNIRATTNDAGAFASTPLLEPLPSETGGRLRLTASVPNGPTLVRAVPVKYISELTFSIPPSTVEGQNVSLSVFVKPIDGAPNPTGPITTTVGPVTLVDQLNSVTSGTTYSSAKLPTGAFSVASVYPGDAYYDGGLVRTTLGVASRTPVMDITTSTLTPEIGVPFQVFATVRVDAGSAVGGGAVPTGAVTLYESGIPLGTGKVLWSTSLPVPQMLVSRDYTATRFEPALKFSASYVGDANYRPAASATITPVVQRAQPSVNISAVPSIFNLNPAPGSVVRFSCDVPISFNIGLNYPGGLTVGAPPFSLAATLPSGTNVPLASGLMELTKPGVAAAVATATLPNDTIRVTATFPGDAQLKPVTSAWLPVKIIPVPVQVQFSATDVDPATDALVLSATVTNDAGKGCQIGAPQGAVEFYIGAVSLGQVLLDGKGNAALRILRPLFEGPQNLFVRYLGDPLHTQSDSPTVTITFNPVSQ